MNDFHYNREYNGAYGRRFPEGKGYLETYGRGLPEGTEYLKAYDMSSGMWVPMSSQAREEEKERDYWQQLYPEEVRRVQRAVEQACDQVDYEGSFLYDEYPDRIALQRMCEGIRQMITMGENGQQEGTELHMAELGIMECTQCSGQSIDRILPPIQPEPRPPMPGPNPGPKPPMPGPKPPMPGPNPGPGWHHLIQVLLFDEISRRRKNRRRYWSF